MSEWNPWHGCRKISPGCEHCYVYRRDSRYGLNSRRVYKTKSFDLPIRHNSKWQYDLLPQDGVVNTCFTSDFFLNEADLWRPEAFAMMKRRQDLKFFFITKRIHRIYECLPDDWGDGYDNVTIGCTVENQTAADFRLPIFVAAPIKHKLIICAPLLEEILLQQYLSPDIEQLAAGGESGSTSRPCRYEWVLSLRRQAMAANVSFAFHQTGARLIKNGREYRIPRRLQHSQARKAGIDFIAKK